MPPGRLAASPESISIIWFLIVVYVKILIVFYDLAVLQYGKNKRHAKVIGLFVVILLLLLTVEVMTSIGAIVIQLSF